MHSRFLFLPVFFLHGEAPALDLGNTADHEEAFRVDLVDQLFRLGQFPAGQHRKHQLGILPQIAAFCLDQGDAPVEILEDGLADLLGFFTDHLDFNAGSAHEQHFVQHHGVDHHQHHAIEQLFRGLEQPLAQQDTHIKEIHTH